MSGTIQGPIESIFRKSTYSYLPLPLRLLWDEEVFAISKSIAESDNLRDYVNNRTFHRCISDFGGQVRALEIFYIILSKQIINEVRKVNYIDIMPNVMGDLEVRYPFNEFSTTIMPVIARAILNIPVNDNQQIDKKDEKDEKMGLTYVDLSSKGILSLEPASEEYSYVRMPYVWVWILTSYNKSSEFWDVMFDQKSHVLWQDFEDFNMRF